MKKLLVSLFLLSLMPGFRAQASHYFGADLRYEYNGTNYTIELTEYSRCYTLTSGVAPTEFIMIKSASCGITRNKSVLHYRDDTLREMYCASAGVACSNTGYPFIIVRHYADTVNLPPCSDWKMVWTGTPRDPAVANLSQGSSYYWVEAFLNNVTAPNSSGYINNYPPFIQPYNALLSTPIHQMDIEGDSVFSQMIVPQDIPSGGNYSYIPGYTFSNPMAGMLPIQVDNNLKMLKSMSGAIGKFALAMRTYDYRNGQMVGYSSRDWEIMSLTMTHPKAPVPASTNLVYTTCPGQQQTITISFMDSVATDSVYLSFAPDNNWTYSTTYNPGPGAGSGTISWTTPATLNPATTPYFYIRVTARDNACPMHGLSACNILVKTAQCVTDSVWPGDANADKVVNLYDALNIALAYGSSGPIRPGASLSWTAQACSNWNAGFNNNVNYKHADCNGDGTVNSTDLAAITANYGLSHPKGGYFPNGKITGLPDLYADPAGVIASPGATLNLPVKLGDAASAMSNLYGLAASVRISGIMPAGTSIDYPVSWLGTAANTIRFSRPAANGIDWTYARTDHQPAGGNGTLGTLHFTIPSGTAPGQKIILTFQGVKMVDTAGNELTGYNVLSDTLTVVTTAVGQMQSPLAGAQLVPNPSPDRCSLQLSLQKAGFVSIAVTDLAGREVWQQQLQASAGTNEVVLPANGLSAGMYLVHISGNGWQYPSVLKWTKY